MTGRPRFSNTRAFVARLRQRAHGSAGLTLLDLPVRDAVEGARGLGDLPVASDLRAKRRESTDPERASFFLPPRLLRPAHELLSTGAVYVSGAAQADYVPSVRINAGPVPAAQQLRVLYVDPVVLSDGRPGPAALVPHVLKSLAVSTSTSTLGAPLDAPETLLVSSAGGDPVQFYGFECAQVVTGATSRPLMLGVAENLRDGSVEYVLVDHDETTGAPSVRYVQGVPRGPAPTTTRAIYRRVMPGIAFGIDRRLPFLPTRRILMALVVGVDADPTQADLVVGFLSIDDAEARFLETDRARIPRGESIPPMEIYESVPVAWHPGLNQWIVMLTVGDNWEGRFQLVSGAGRLFRGLDGRLPVEKWWPTQYEKSHSGNVVSVNPETGNVCFQTAHNTASGPVRENNTFSNQWEGLYTDASDPEQPPDTFPDESHAVRIGRGGRWYTSPADDARWEWQESGMGGRVLGPTPGVTRDLEGHGAAMAVSRRIGSSGGMSGVISTALFPGSFTLLGEHFGVHRIVGVGNGRSAHVAAWSLPDSLRVAIGVAFTEARRAPV